MISTSESCVLGIGKRFFLTFFLTDSLSCSRSSGVIRTSLAVPSTRDITSLQIVSMAFSDLIWCSDILSSSPSALPTAFSHSDVRASSTRFLTIKLLYINFCNVNIYNKKNIMSNILYPYFFKKDPLFFGGSFFRDFFLVKGNTLSSRWNTWSLIQYHFLSLLCSEYM